MWCRGTTRERYFSRESPAALQLPGAVGSRIHASGGAELRRVHRQARRTCFLRKRNHKYK